MPQTCRNMKLVTKLYKEFLQLTSMKEIKQQVKDAQVTNKIWGNTQ